jgi:hypothetical protein
MSKSAAARSRSQGGAHTRRRHPRAPLPTTAILFTDRKPVGPCVVEDVSVGGMRVVTGVAIKRGRLVSVLMELPERPLLAMGQVARHELRGRGEHVLALSFLDLPREDAERLQQVVARTLAETHPTVEFFDTADGGRRKRLVLVDDPDSAK